MIVTLKKMTAEVFFFQIFLDRYYHEMKKDDMIAEGKSPDEST